LQSPRNIKQDVANVAEETIARWPVTALKVDSEGGGRDVVSNTEQTTAETLERARGERVSVDTYYFASCSCDDHPRHGFTHHGNRHDLVTFELGVTVVTSSTFVDPSLGTIGREAVLALAGVDAGGAHVVVPFLRETAFAEHGFGHHVIGQISLGTTRLVVATVAYDERTGALNISWSVGDGPVEITVLG
jgi:hypothetical protein